VKSKSQIREQLAAASATLEILEEQFNAELSRFRADVEAQKPTNPTSVSIAARKRDTYAGFVQALQWALGESEEEEIVA
jgi:hypothetical protein